MGTRTESVRVTADVSNFTTRMAAAGAAAKGFADDLDNAERRSTALRDTIVGLSPALVPLATAAVPAIAGLSASLVAAGAAAATAGLAFSGVGGSLTALNTYQLNPTAANLQTLQAKMALMAPAAREFVTFLDGLSAPLSKLREAAAQGFLPGLEAGITDALTQLPTVTRLVGTVADEMGRLSKAGGQSLTGPFWTQFLGFLANTTAPALDTLGRTLGNAAEGVAALFQAFTPLGTDFNNALLNMSRDFSTWAQSLSQTQGFADFTNYIRETGPQVVSTLGSLANALIQIGEAAAPIGRVMVPAIGALADVIATIADSPAGTALVATAAGLAALNRALGVYDAAKASAVASMLGKLNLTTVGGLTKATAGVVGFGVALDGLQQPADSARSALELIGGGAAIGAMFGPEGALIGGAVGGLTALGKAMLSTGDDATTTVPKITSFIDTLDQVTGATTGATRGQVATQLEQFKVTLDGVTQSALQLGKGVGISGGSLVDAVVGSPADLQATQDRIDGIVKGLQASLNPVGGSGEAVAVDPALVKSTNDKIKALQNLSKYLADNRSQLLSDEQAFQRVSAAAAGGSGKIADFGNQMLTTADSASQLATVLDSLFGPKMNLSAATDAFTSSLRGLNEALAKGSNALKGQSDAALTNRAAVRGSATALEGMLKAQADAGASTRKLSASLSAGRARLLAAGQAAGIAKKDMNDYLDTLGLTPKLVSTLIKAYGVDQANAAAKGLQRAYNALPKDVRTDIAANGVSANATVDSLMSKYQGLSRADATTILKAVDQASGPIDSVRLRLSQLNGYTATTYIRTITTGGAGPLGPGVQVTGADGMVIDYYGAGGMRENHIAQIAPAGAWRVWAEPETGGEAYIPFAPAKRERSRDIADETVRRLGGDVQWFASGGMTKKQQDQAVAQALRAFDINGTKQSAGDIRDQLRSLEKALRDTFGRDAKWLNRIDSLGDRIAARAAREDKLQNALGKMTDELRSTRQASAQYSQGVSGSIDNDIFGNGLAGLQVQLRADRNDNEAMLRALRRGRRQGLSGSLFKALAASGDLGTAQQVSRMSRKEVDRLERLYRQRNQAQSQLGGFASQQVYGQQIRQQTQHVRNMSRRVDQMNRSVEKLERKIERGVNDGARRGVAAGINTRDHRNNTKRKSSR